MDLFQPSCRAIAQRAAFLHKKAASKRCVGVRKHRFWLTVLGPDALKKLGNPSGLPSFFHTPIIQNCRVVPLAAKSIAAIASALAAQNGARHFAARNRAAGCPAALRRALFAPGKFYLPGPRSQTPVSYTHLDVYKRQASGLLSGDPALPLHAQPPGMARRRAAPGRGIPRDYRLFFLYGVTPHGKSI